MDSTTRKRVEQELLDGNRRLHLFGLAAGELLRRDDPLECLRQIYDQLATELDLQVCFHYAVQDDRGTMRLVAWRGVPEEVARRIESLEAGETICGKALAGRTPIVVEDVQHRTDPATQFVRGLGITAYVCFPLVARGQPIGTLSFGSRTRTSLDFRSMALIRAISDQVAMAIVRKRAEEALRASEAEYRAMFELASSGKSETDLADRRFLRVNRKLCEMTGYTEQELLGMTAFDVTHPDDRAWDEAAFRRNVEQQVEEWSIEKRYLCKDGQVIWVQVNGTILRDAKGRPYRNVSVVQDITAHKLAEESLRKAHDELERRVEERTRQLASANAALEEQAEQLRAMSLELTRSEERERRRLSQILHDHLQQLLVTARMRIAMLRGPAMPSKVRETLAQVDELLDQSIAESRSLTVELSPPVLYDAGLGAALTWLARRTEEQYSLTVAVEADPEAEPEEATRVLLFQAVRELLFNVVKHACADRVEVKMSRNMGGQVAIEVIDNGVGFDPARLEQRKSHGFGLFSIAQRLKVLGGHLTIDAAPGRGSRMVLVAGSQSIQKPAGGTADGPASAARVSWQATASTAVELQAAPRKTIRVLLADDHPLLRKGLADLLGEHPEIEMVGEAADGREAVELAERLRPDVILMDITMPRLNGIEATRQIKAAQPGVCVIGLSMHSESDMAAAMRAAGAAAYLSKSESADSLIGVILGCSRDATNRRADG